MNAVHNEPSVITTPPFNHQSAIFSVKVGSVKENTINKLTAISTETL